MHKSLQRVADRVPHLGLALAARQRQMTIDGNFAERRFLAIRPRHDYTLDRRGASEAEMHSLFAPGEERRVAREPAIRLPVPVTSSTRAPIASRLPSVFTSRTLAQCGPAADSLINIAPDRRRASRRDRHRRRCRSRRPQRRARIAAPGPRHRGKCLREQLAAPRVEPQLLRLPDRQAPHVRVRIPSPLPTNTSSQPSSLKSAATALHGEIQSNRRARSPSDARGR